MHRSTFSQQPHEPTTLARFQLAKFSYTTLSINHRGPLTWSHVFGNGDLFGVFESYAALSSTRVLFRVVHNGWETLVRRFQVKFSSDRDFYSVLATLSDINCPFAESNVSSVRPMSGPTSSLLNLGQFDPVSRSQHCPSTVTENSTSVIGMALPYRAATTSSTTAHPSDAVFPTSLSGSTTISSTSRQISTLGGISRTPFGSTSSRPNVQPSNTDADPFKRPCTSIASSVNEVDNIPPASPSQATGTAEASSSPPKTKKAASTKRAAKGRKPPKKDHTVLPSAPPEDLTKSPDQQTTTTTATAKTTSTPVVPFENVGLPAPANLAKYTSEPAADRTASLQAWLCAHLEDPNFLQLCEDIEGIAERYYLGERREW
ncbi:hypothetical protein AN1928.2 [Aspergillus nidulans FGSC A4]|uniref:Uncharacterized protein n=1 Tax=Emericella nidulans (strain FGSC A4 / ATCC 38163 / CBS 112.46 / NRRL 194 / M139) TaxID=227321 RepID=Q5BC02_EMENI|nr:hypothetical protein [Aspergillus nidulans FGSC A4]EAA65093.1 hypothetical protein AN1928.2 [Aspergillus nidulans FGSC A4]CBF85842.1 TPA: hypothetical protein ANIA_01928 [Aspergillus nidulans FGSC A4]|eukprot:XP_659532.1 hypothetical protein AN1928.2 [Aspergillus nidulans FGSC A4]